MAAPYQHKRSTTAAAVPTLLDGELGINQRDGKLFWKDHNGTVQSKKLTDDGLIVVQSTPPDNTAAIWLDPTDNTTSGGGGGFRHIGSTTPDTTGWAVNDMWYDTSTET